MTKSEAGLMDNDGRCEICNSEESKYTGQTTVSVYCGGGLGWSKMWACYKCKPKHERLTKARDDLEKAKKEVKRLEVEVSDALKDYSKAGENDD